MNDIKVNETENKEETLKDLKIAQIKVTLHGMTDETASNQCKQNS